MHTLQSLGWNDALAAAFGPHEREGRIPARVSSEHKNLYRVLTETSEPIGEVSGRLRHDERFPAVGDWVAVAARDPDHVTIHDILPRRSHFARLAAGVATVRQLIGANIDVAFILQGLDRDFNPRRLERALLLAWEGGVEPVIVLNKADACPDTDLCLQRAQEVAAGVPVHLISALHGHGIDTLHSWLGTGRTLALIGSSGAGKSTLVNRLAGADLQRTHEVRDTDQRGRHTTTHRQLLMLPPDPGGLILDTPGMRELQLVDGDGLDAAFADVAALAAHCHFNDCLHRGEPGCAVEQALDDGLLTSDRLEGWRKLQREQRFAASRTDERIRIEERKKWKIIHRQMRARTRG